MNDTVHIYSELNAASIFRVRQNLNKSLRLLDLDTGKCCDDHSNRFSNKINFSTIPHYSTRLDHFYSSSCTKNKLVILVYI